jgi:nicotinamide phosphoribosyltransferase
VQLERFIIPSIFATDSYKLSHPDQYPFGTEMIFSTWIPRSDKIARMTARQIDNANPTVVFYGLHIAMQQLAALWQHWFDRSEQEVVKEYIYFITAFLKTVPTPRQIERVKQLHQLGYLPIRVQHLPEGTATKPGVLQYVIYNTGGPDFYWLTNYLETAMSALVWPASTNATIARNYRKLAEEWAARTCDDMSHVDWQCHDFSMRGMMGIATPAEVQTAHLLFFNGTDTLPSLFAANHYYEGFVFENYGSVPATEHSVMCAGGKDNEQDTIYRLIKTYPAGILSVVSDTWDFWSNLTVLLPTLKDQIMAREGKYVVRPDSGDPVDVICGDANADWNSPQQKGAIECLWETFGGTINSKGYKVLDPHIGLVYGDSITLDRAKRIFERLAQKGFAASNVVLGIGSFTYMCNTRDTWGFALKATGAIISGEEHALFKDPLTDDGTKRSLCGFATTRFDPKRQEFYTVDRLTFEEATDLNHPGAAFMQTDFKDLSGGMRPSWPLIQKAARRGLALID